jgi:lysophospholipase L1-like esterase
MDSVVSQYAAAVVGLSQSLHVPLVDVHAGFLARYGTNPTVFTGMADYLHPNDIGHRYVADLLEPVLVSAVPEPSGLFLLAIGLIAVWRRRNIRAATSSN